MTYRLVGLLEKPSAKSFGMVATVIASLDEDVPSVSGLAPASSHRRFADAEEAAFLLRAQGLDLSSLGIAFEERPENLVACWFGTEFLDGCREHGVPLPEIPEDAFEAPEVGGVSPAKIWLGPPQEGFPKLERWLVKAAPIAVKRRSLEIARLMRWCLPGREETHAAEWYAETDPEKRARRLKEIRSMWYRQEKALTASLLEHRLERVVERLLDAGR